MNLRELKYEIYLLALLLIVTIVFSGVTDNGFVAGWDDEGQVTTNTDIRNLSADNLKTIFKSYYVGMYQPVTTLSYAIDYKFSKLNPSTYHRTGLFLHLINIVLVFLLIKSLTGNKTTSLIVAAFFALHPLNVETIAWVSARSNMMYTLFYLLSILLYLRYLKSGKIYHIILVFLFFVLSLLSKATAVTLPLILLLLDVFINKKINIKDFIWKIPFFVLSLVFVAIAFSARQEFLHISNISGVFNTFERIILILFSFSYYLFELLFPVNLSPIHYYPVSGNTGKLDFLHYAGAFVALLFGAYMVRLVLRVRKKKEWNNIFLFGSLFFVITISVVIHFIPIGFQLVAERYVYLPYTGLFLIMATALEKSEKKYKKAIISLTIIYIVLFGYLSYRQIPKWKDTATLMADVIADNPESAHAYIVRADSYYLTGNYAKAIEDYNETIKRAPAYYTAYVNRANVYAAVKNYQAAITDLDKALNINNKQPAAFYNRGLAKFNLGRYNEAVHDFDSAIKLKPDYAQAFLYRGVAYGSIGNIIAAGKDLHKAAELDKNNPKIWFSLGVVYAKNRNYTKAVDCYSKAITINPDNANAYLQRGIAFLMQKQTGKSCNDFKKASMLGNKKANDFLAKYCTRHY